MKTRSTFKCFHFTLLNHHGKIVSKLLIALAVWCMVSCKPAIDGSMHNTTYFDNDTTEVQTGGVEMIPIQTPKGKFKVWTKRIGNNPKIKILVLAGGPGLPHDYLEVFESFFPKEGFELIYYDELGCGNSENPNDSTLYNLNRSVENVELVRKALNLNKDNFYLYGHSCGGTTAMEYAVKYQQNIKALIVSGMSSSGKEFNRYILNVLAKQIPAKIRDTLWQYESKKDFDNPKYTALVMQNFYAKFICRIPLNKWPEPLTRAFSKLNKPYYVAMQGPNELDGFVGKLKDWDISKRLPLITVPTLMIGSKYDEIDPLQMKWMSTLVKNGKYLYCANGSHLSMYDEQPFYMKGIIQFIKDVDSGSEK